MTEINQLFETILFITIGIVILAALMLLVLKLYELWTVVDNPVNNPPVIEHPEDETHHD